MENANQNHPYTIVVAVDFCPPCEAAVKDALRIAAEHEGSEVHAVHAVDPSTAGHTRTVRIKAEHVALRDLPGRMRDYVAALAPAFERPVKASLGIHVRIGEPVQVIQQLAVDVQADLLVVGTHGREGLQHMMFGSVAEALVRAAHCPVLVARPIDYDGLQPTEQLTPPCPDCVAVRKESGGARWWCERHHAIAHRETHTYSGMAPVHWVAGSADVHGPGTADTQM